MTPVYNMVTGELVVETKKRQNSSSSSESDSSMASTSGAAGGRGEPSQERQEQIRLGKDEKIAREAGIKLDIKQDIVNPPMDEFNDMLSKEELSEEQLNICRDIRRRGKNKVAAQNCRKRKLEQIDELQKKVEEAKRRQYRLKVEHESLLANYAGEAATLSRLNRIVLQHQNRDPDYYCVQVVGEEVKVLPKSAVPEEERFPKPVERLRLQSFAAPQQYHAAMFGTGRAGNASQYGEQHQVWE